MRSKDEFLGSVSHELRTPLTSVLGIASELSERPADFGEDERQSLLVLLTEEAADMTDIINDLLVAAKRDPSDLVVDLQPIDVVAVTKALLGRISESFVMREPEGPIGAEADPARLQQILRNLLVNSVRYGGPRREVRFEDREGVVAVQVCDDGTGVPRDDWETMFEPYRRVEGSTGVPDSVGLGLTISRMLARRMDGDLTYRYEAGESIFEVTLPSTRAATTAARGEGSGHRSST
jgi:signal transduction histidine kinase